MRSLFFAAILTVSVLIKSKAAPHQTNTTHASSSCSSDTIDAQIHERFMNLEKNFEANCFKMWTRDLSGTWAVSPVGNLISVLNGFLGIQKSTRTELANIIGLTDRDLQDIECGYGPFLEGLNNYTKAGLSIHNDVYFPLSDIQSQTNVARETNSFFKSLMNPPKDAHLDAGSVNRPAQHYHAIVASRIHFEGLWKKTFESSHSRFIFFYPYDRERILVKSIYKHGRFRCGHLRQLGVTFIELPYQSNGQEDGVSLFILRSDSSSSYSNLLNNIGTIDVGELIHQYRKKHVHFYLPKFRISTRTTGSEWMLRFLGSQNSFESKTNLSGKSYPPGFIFDEIQTEITVEVGENDVDNSATAEIFHRIRRTRSPREHEDFFVNRPFGGILATTGAKSINLFTFVTDGSIFKRRQPAQ